MAACTLPVCVDTVLCLEERGIEFVHLRERMGVMTPGKARSGVGLVSEPRRPCTWRGPPSTSVPLEQHHHDDASKQQVLLVLGEVRELLYAEAALQDGGLLLYAQHVPAVQLRQMGRVEEEAAQGVAQG